MHVFIDTTDILRLQEANQKIKLQRIMFASASHEFRTPLNAIINSFKFISVSFKDLVQNLTQNHSVEILANIQIQKSINTINKFSKTGETSSLLMLALVDDILNLSKIDNGTFSINIDKFSLPELLEEVHSLFIIQCSSKNIKLNYEIDHCIENCLVKSDRNRIRQILLNLVSNSLKFTFEGSISIRASLVTLFDDKYFIKFNVIDTGIGIKMENQDKLFKLFGIVPENNIHNPNGCGLGLTIVK